MYKKKNFKSFRCQRKIRSSIKTLFLFALLYSTTEVYEYSCNLKFKKNYSIFKIDFGLFMHCVKEEWAFGVVFAKVQNCKEEKIRISRKQIFFKTKIRPFISDIKKCIPNFYWFDSILNGSFRSLDWNRHLLILIVSLIFPPLLCIYNGI